MTTMVSSTSITSSAQYPTPMININVTVTRHCLQAVTSCIKLDWKGNSCSSKKSTCAPWKLIFVRSNYGVEHDSEYMQATVDHEELEHPRRQRVNIVEVRQVGRNVVFRRIVCVLVGLDLPSETMANYFRANTDQ